MHLILISNVCELWLLFIRLRIMLLSCILQNMLSFLESLIQYINLLFIVE